MMSSDQLSPKISSEMLTGQPDRRLGFRFKADQASRLTFVLQVNYFVIPIYARVV